MSTKVQEKRRSSSSAPGQGSTNEKGASGYGKRISQGTQKVDGTDPETEVSGSFSSSGEEPFSGARSTTQAKPTVRAINTTTAKSTTTSTTTTRLLPPVPSARLRPLAGKTILADPSSPSQIARHSMPQYRGEVSGSGISASPDGASPRDSDRPSAKRVTTASASGARPRSPSSPTSPVHASRMQQMPLPSPRGSRADADAVADRNIKAAQAAAKSVPLLRHKAERLKAIQSLMSQAAATATSARGPLLEALAQSINSAPGDDRGACLAELRMLCAEMSMEYRKTFLCLLIKEVIRNREASDDDSDSASDSARATDSKQFKTEYDDRTERLSTVHKLLEQPISTESLSSLAKAITDTASPHNERTVLVHLFALLERLDPAIQKKVIDSFDNAKVLWATVLASVFQSRYMAQIEKLAKSGGHSLSSIFMGLLAGDGAAAQKLLLILGRVDLPAALHVYLCEHLGEIRRSARPAWTTQREAGALLMEAVTLSGMSDANRCLLIHSLSVIDPGTLYLALLKGELNEANDFLAYAHEVIASVIDIGTCYALPSEYGTDKALASYSTRVAEMLKSKAARAIADVGRCAYDKVQMRALMLDSTDTEKMKGAIVNVLESSLSFDEKLALLKCETTPVGKSVAAHVAEVRFKTARALCVKKFTGSKNRMPEYEEVAGKQEDYDIAYTNFEESLDPDDRGTIKQAARKAMVEARASRLPAMHVNAINGNSVRINAYLQSVLAYCNVLPPEQLAAFVELAGNGATLFQCAMVHGTKKVIQGYMSAILASGLPEQTKIALLEARRQSDGLGSFYLAMSTGNQDQAESFVQSILASEIAAEAKFGLLQCAKIALPKTENLGADAVKQWKKAATTARAEAERMKHHTLVINVCHMIERSTLSREQRDELQMS